MTQRRTQIEEVEDLALKRVEEVERERAERARAEERERAPLIEAAREVLGDELVPRPGGRLTEPESTV